MFDDIDNLKPLPQETGSNRVTRIRVTVTAAIGGLLAVAGAFALTAQDHPASAVTAFLFAGAYIFSAKLLSSRRASAQRAGLLTAWTATALIILVSLLALMLTDFISTRNRAIAALELAALEVVILSIKPSRPRVIRRTDRKIASSLQFSGNPKSQRRR